MNFETATPRQRIFASLIDGLLLYPFTLLDHVLPQAQWIVFGYWLLNFQLYWLYNTLFHGFRGQTLGKLFMGIVVVRHTDGRSIGLRRAVLRDSPYIVLIAISSGAWIYANVAYFGGWYSEGHSLLIATIFRIVSYLNLGWTFAELVSMFLQNERRSIHDLIASTIVIRKQPPA